MNSHGAPNWWHYEFVALPQLLISCLISDGLAYIDSFFVGIISRFNLRHTSRWLMNTATKLPLISGVWTEFLLCIYIFTLGSRWGRQVRMLALSLNYYNIIFNLLQNIYKRDTLPVTLITI